MAGSLKNVEKNVYKNLSNFQKTSFTFHFAQEKINFRKKKMTKMTHKFADNFPTIMILSQAIMEIRRTPSLIN